MIIIDHRFIMRPVWVGSGHWGGVRSGRSGRRGSGHSPCSRGAVQLSAAVPFWANSLADSQSGSNPSAGCHGRLCQGFQHGRGRGRQSVPRLADLLHVRYRWGVGKPVPAHPGDVTDRATGRMSRRASPTPGRRAGGLGSGDQASRAAWPHGTVRAPATPRHTPWRCRAPRVHSERRTTSPGNQPCVCRRPSGRDERFILGAHANLPDDEGSGWSGQVEDCAGARPHAWRRSGRRSSDAGAKPERPIRMSGGPPAATPLQTGCRRLSRTGGSPGPRPSTHAVLPDPPAWARVAIAPCPRLSPAAATGGPGERLRPNGSDSAGGRFWRHAGRNFPGRDLRFMIGLRREYAKGRAVLGRGVGIDNACAARCRGRRTARRGATIGTGDLPAGITELFGH
jgi:hypothetical protein